MTTAEKLQTIAENEERVYKAGKQAEYDAFWDEFQENGTRKTYAAAFQNSYWRGAAYNPKYPIAPGNANGCDAIFAWNAKITDTKVPITIYDSVTSLFNYCSALVRIPKLIWNGVTNVSGMFGNCSSLEEITCEGVIDITGVNLQWSKKLTRDSLQSIINALSLTTTGLTVTLSKTAVNGAFATSEGANDGTTSAEWLALIGTRSNWTISLV